MNTQQAWQLRESGLGLPIQQYDNPRITEIAKQQAKLIKEHDDLDRELKSLAESTKQ